MTDDATPTKSHVANNDNNSDDNGLDDETRTLWNDLVRWVMQDCEDDAGGSGSGSCSHGVSTDRNQTQTRTKTQQKQHPTTTARTASSGGGYVHPSLALRGNGPSRGVVATVPIPKGELLIRIPSDRVLSGEEDETPAETAITTSSVSTATTASPWLRCVGAFVRAKQALKNAQAQAQAHMTTTTTTTTTTTNRATCTRTRMHEPYLRSLPAFGEYETLQQWSVNDDVRPFLRGTTLASLVGIDRATNGIRTRYRQSVEPYLRRIGAIVREPRSKKEHESNPQQTSSSGCADVAEDAEDETYRCFLEASMCISTRGFHLLPTTANNNPNDASSQTNNNSNSNANEKYGGPFLLPVIDLLNHDPNRACTTLRRYNNDDSDNDNDNNYRSCFQMIAERDITEGEELFHSYGTDLTSAQLLQTFGFVPRDHSERHVPRAGAKAIDIDIAEVAVAATTPVGLRTRDHFLEAAKRVKESSFPDSLVRRLRRKRGRADPGSTEEEEYDNDDYDDDEDCFWEVREIPDRPMMGTAPPSGTSSLPSAACSSIEPDEEVLIAARTESGESDGDRYLLTEALITLLAAQFLPEDAFLEIFPQGNNDTDVRLDRSILMEDWYLGMLVCQSLLVAIELKTKEYVGVGEDVPGTEAGKTDIDIDIDTESGNEATNAIYNNNNNNNNNNIPTTAVGRRLSSLIRSEAGRIDSILRAKAGGGGNERELYGRTIRIEELKNLAAFCDEIEALVSSMSPVDDESEEENKNAGGDDHHHTEVESPLDSTASQPPSKKPKTE
eukprot:jgi/Psemu1/32131/gm1.32131_g